MTGAARSLRDLQRWFAAASTHPRGAAAGSREASHALGAPAAELESWITRGPGLSALERLQIYNEGYFARLVECLIDDYPALNHAIGAASFERLARAYIQQYPSRSPSLNAYGRRMSAFCRGRPDPWSAFASDLARLEWALVELVHAPAGSKLAPDALSRIPTERWPFVRFLPSPALSLLDFGFPVNEFYQAFRDGGEPELPAARTSATAVFRDGLRLWRLDLSETAAGLLRDLIHGMPLGPAIERLERRVQDTERLRSLGGELQRWLGT